jgi:5-methylcytosine-specific restriction protein A
MALRESLEKIMLEYPLVSHDNFNGHSFVSYVRDVVPKSISASLELPGIYRVKASAGNGSWAKVPWIAIFNKLVTDNVKSGFYCVYLFRADFSGVYLSLNQGIADKRDLFGLGKSRDILRDQAKLFKDKLGSDKLREFSDSLDLKLDSIPKATTSRRLGLAYEAGNIGSKFYSRESLPDDKELLGDVGKVLEIYFSLFEEVSLKEEAHHNVPISNLSGAKIQLDPLHDFTVLCSNCHSMIHRIKPTPTLEEFRQNLKM